MMASEKVEFLLRRCRGRDRGIGRVTRDLAKFFSNDSIGDLYDDIYNDPVTAIAFQSVAQAMANDPEVLDFKTALDRLGESGTRKAALAAGVVAAIPDKDDALLFDTTMFRRRCLFLAFLQEDLAERCNNTFLSSAFVTGLLLDIGYLLLYETCDSDLQLCLYSRLKDERLNVVQTEKFYMGIDHCSISAAVAADVNMSNDVIEGIRNHHSPAAVGPNYQNSADMCHIVSWLGDNQQYKISPGLKKQALETESLERLCWGSDFKIQISDAVQRASTIADAVIADSLPKIEYVRRYAI